MLKEVFYLWVLFRGKKDSRFQPLYVLKQVSLTGFYDSGVSFFHILFLSETKFPLQGGHIFEKTFSEKFLRVGEYRY